MFCIYIYVCWRNVPYTTCRDTCCFRPTHNSVKGARKFSWKIHFVKTINFLCAMKTKENDDGDDGSKLWYNYNLILPLFPKYTMKCNLIFALIILMYVHVLTYKDRVQLHFIELCKNSFFNFANTCLYIL